MLVEIRQMKLNQAVSNNNILIFQFLDYSYEKIKIERQKRQSPPKGSLADCTSSIFLCKQFTPTSAEQSQGKYTRQARWSKRVILEKQARCKYIISGLRFKA